MKILGVNAIGHHDASACIVEGGEITAFVEEERFSRNKYGPGEQPIHSVQWCLESRGLHWGDIDVLATPWVEEEYGLVAAPGYDSELSFGSREVGADRSKWPPGLRTLAARAGCTGDAAPRLVQVAHHLAHAASAYWCGGMDDATVLVVDGEGDRVSTTVAHAKDGRIVPLRQYSTVDSLGQFYACVTEFLGLGNFGEGKLMGLAPYGHPRFQFPEINFGEGEYQIELHAALRRFDPAGTDYRAIVQAWMARLTDQFGDPRPARDRGTPSELADWTQLDRDIAASAQQTLEEVLCHLVRAAIRQTGSSNLVVAGGVALNCTANGALAALGEVDGFFVQPVAGDNGAPIGAALHAAAMAGEARMTTMRSVAFGPAFAPAQCAAALDEVGLTYRESVDVAHEAALLLGQGQVVCWYQGAMEGGPRALGHRSILASPETPEARDRVNDIKRRARWRPLAPSVCAENVADVFVSGRPSPFMIVRDWVRPEWRHRLPAVTHVDHSARPQAVSKSTDALYWSLLDRFQQNTGLPALVNTSFNADNEPIVCTPCEAVRTFLTREADALCMGPFIVQSPKPGSTR